MGAIGDGLHDRLSGNKADEVVVQNLPGRFRVEMGSRVVHDVLDILAAIINNQVAAAGMILEERSNVVDLCADSDITGLGGVMRGDVGLRNGGQCSTRHCVAKSRSGVCRRAAGGANWIEKRTGL